MDWNEKKRRDSRGTPGKESISKPRPPRGSKRLSGHSLSDEAAVEPASPGAVSRQTLKPISMVPRSILIVDHMVDLGGAEIALLRLLAELDRRRFAPVVLLFSDGPLVPRLREIGVEV